MGHLLPRSGRVLEKGRPRVPVATALTASLTTTPCALRIPVSARVLSGERGWPELTCCFEIRQEFIYIHIQNTARGSGTRTLRPGPAGRERGPGGVSGADFPDSPPHPGEMWGRG